SAGDVGGGASQVDLVSVGGGSRDGPVVDEQGDVSAEQAVTQGQVDGKSHGQEATEGVAIVLAGDDDAGLGGEPGVWFGQGEHAVDVGGVETVGPGRVKVGGVL